MKGLVFSTVTGGLINGGGSVIKGKNFFDGGGIPKYAPKNIPQSTKVKSNVRDSYAKGVEGQNKARTQLGKEGYSIEGENVSYRVDGSFKVGRADFIVKKGDVRTMVEVKNGPKASYTPNQRVNYPKVNHGNIVVPFGKNSLHTPMQPYRFRLIEY